MEQKLYQVQTLLEELQCPLLEPPSDPLPANEEAARFEKLYGPSLLHLLLPTEQRISLFKWLLQKYDPAILEGRSICSPVANDTERTPLPKVEIEICLRQLGLVTTIKPIAKLIEGKEDIEDSLGCVHKLCEFVMASLVTGSGLEVISGEAIKAINEIASNQVWLWQT